MKNTLSDLNDYLFEQLERINDDDMDDDDLEKQMKKADTACKIADRIIQNGELAFKTMQHMDDYGKEFKTPEMLESKG